jgi:hypothetical protein
MRQVILIEKKENFWRVEKTSCLSFIKYLKNYFLLDTTLLLINSFEDIQYADIDENGFCMISYFFELIRIDKNKLYIKGFSPKKYNLLWCDVLNIRVCIQTVAGSRQIVTLHMKIK